MRSPHADLLLSSAYNSLTQHAHVEFMNRGHSVGVATATSAEGMRAAVNQFRPDLILCPMLAQVIPQDLWETYPFSFHPGIVGDRGGNSLDWAILNQQFGVGRDRGAGGRACGLGPVWATCHCKLREASKSSLYRDEIAAAAMKAMMVAVQRFENGSFVPAPLDYSRPDVRGRYRPLLKPEQRMIDWLSHPVSTIICKIRSADGAPGVLDEIGGKPVYLDGAHAEGDLVGRPGRNYCPASWRRVPRGRILGRCGYPISDAVAPRGSASSCPQRMSWGTS